MINRLVLLCSLFVITACASAPSTVSLADIRSKYESQRIVALPVTYKPRALPSIEVCGKEMVCMSVEDFTVNEEDKERLMLVIQQLNLSIDSLTAAANNRLDAVTHCEYANAKKDEALAYMEQARGRAELTSTIKQLATFVGCGALLWAK